MSNSAVKIACTVLKQQQKGRQQDEKKSYCGLESKAFWILTWCFLSSWENI